MAGKNTAVFGIYTDRSSVDRAVEALKAAGFSNNDVSALFPENKGTKDFAHEKNTKAPEGATTGAGTGALLGGGLGWLAELARWQFLASDPSSLLVRLWRRWLEPQLEAQ